MSAGESNSIAVLVVGDGRDGPSATQNISFGQPLSPLLGPGKYRLAFEKDHREPSDIARAFAAHAPGLLVLSRFTSERGSEWIRLARAAGIPVVFHIDDDLLAVPMSLGEAKFKAYNSPERLQALRANIEGSDLVYVSTPALKQRFEEHGIARPMVAGDLYCSVSPAEIGAVVPPATGPVIGYMGTGGHSADLAMVMPAICAVMEEIPSLQFEVFGTIRMPSELARFGPRARHIPPVPDYADFIPHLRTLGWWVGVAPLEDNPFNRCKADTKWVEYSLAGMAVVASDLPVYHRSCGDGCGVLARDGKSWKEGLLKLVLSPSLREHMVANAQAKLRSAYTHDILRDQVERIFAMALAKTRQAADPVDPGGGSMET